MDKSYLYTPGPTPVPPKVLAAMAQPMIGHRGQSFAKMHARLVEKAKVVFQTKNDLFVMTQSGTGGLETAIANAVSPGDRVLAIVTGNFGERFAKIAAAYGAEVVRVDFAWGKPFDLDKVKGVWEEFGPFKLVLATHNETSTGVTNDIQALGEFVASTDALLAVDAVSSMGAMDIRTDEWQVDFMITSSQKALMVPPGLALVSVSPKAWPVVESNRNSRFYFSLPQARKSSETWNTAWTPAVALFYGLEAALDMILDEGLKNVYSRHKRMARAARAAAEALGFKLLADEKTASDTVTAIMPGEQVPVSDLLKSLREAYGVTFAGGQGQLKGKIFRIGHMGYCTELDVLTAVAALEMSLQALGVPLQLGAGVAAAQRSLVG